MEKEKGLYKKYEVTKLSNPEKVIDAVVLEFNDPLSRLALRRYARLVRQEGFIDLSRDIIRKCNEYETEAPQGKRETDCKGWI